MEIDSSQSDLYSNISNDTSNDMGSNGIYDDVENINFTSKEKLYFIAIDKYYKKLDPNKIKLMIDIVEGNSNVSISLRLLDWFVTKYSDKNVIKVKYDNENVNIHISYKAQLKSYKKTYFDPFRRKLKFYYKFKNFNGVKLLTTMGQLNFFKWAYKYNIIKYVQDNFDKLSSAMIISNKDDKIKKRRKREKIKKATIKKNNITVSAEKKLSETECKIIVSFD